MMIQARLKNIWKNILKIIKMNKIYYFAYGSNMNHRRMIDRGVDYSKSELGILTGYKLVINKKSYKNPGLGLLI